MEINAKTQLLCLIGESVKESFSPAIHNKWIKTFSLNLVYLAFRVKREELKDALFGLKAIGAVGANVTSPHKESVIKYLHGLSEEAALIGAVNTIKFDTFFGYNTDIEGFSLSLKKEGFSPKDTCVTVLGAGGGAKAVVFALSKMGAKKIFIANRSFEKAEALCTFLKRKLSQPAEAVFLFSEDLEKKIKCSSLLVNATTIGTKEQCFLPLPEEFLHKDLFVFDLIYNPGKTPLLEAAEKKGARIKNGMDMLLYQASESFHIWTGLKPTPSMIEEAARCIKP